MGSFGISEGNITRKKKKNKNKNPTEYVPKCNCLNATASGEVAQTLAFSTSEQGLDREIQAA